jgi:hypothetical protein
MGKLNFPLYITMKCDWKIVLGPMKENGIPKNFKVKRVHLLINSEDFIIETKELWMT